MCSPVLSCPPRRRRRRANPIKIGYSMALTGGLAPNGKSALLAQKIWEEDVNARGGLLGRPVKLVYYDDQTNQATVPGIYTKLLDIDKVDLIIGGYGTASVEMAKRAPDIAPEDRWIFTSNSICDRTSPTETHHGCDDRQDKSISGPFDNTTFTAPPARPIAHTRVSLFVGAAACKQWSLFSPRGGGGPPDFRSGDRRSCCCGA
jgi:Periplasmic binding protein